MKKQIVEKILHTISGLLGQLLVEVMGNRKAVELVNDAMITINKILDEIEKEA